MVPNFLCTIKLVAFLAITEYYRKCCFLNNARVSFATSHAVCCVALTAASVRTEYPCNSNISERTSWAAAKIMSSTTF